MAKNSKILYTLAIMVVSSYSITAWAATQVQWWHAMGGVNGERVNKIAADFNATQSDYEVVGGIGEPLI